MKTYIAGIEVVNEWRQHRWCWYCFRFTWHNVVRRLTGEHRTCERCGNVKVWPKPLV